MSSHQPRAYGDANPCPRASFPNHGTPTATSTHPNLNLAIVVAISFALQVLSQHNAMLGRFLKSSAMPFADCLLLLALGSLPLLGLEIVQRLRHPHHVASS